MSRWLGEPLCIGLGPGSLALAGVDGTSETLMLPWLSESMPAEVRQLRLSAALTELRRRGASRGLVRLIVADAHLRSWSQVVPVGTRSLADLRAVAMARCLQLFGGGPDDWRITADWHAHGRFVCMATPAWIVRAIESIGPGAVDTLWGLGLTTVRLQTGWHCLGALESGAVILMENDRVTTLRGFALAADPAQRAAQMTLELRRASLREGRAADAEVPWMDALATAAHAFEQDGLRFACKPLLPAGKLDSPPRCDAEVAARLALTGAAREVSK